MSNTFASLCMIALKFSIALFLLRIAVFKTQRVILWVIMGLSGVIHVSFFFAFIFECWPIGYFWGQFAGMEGSCNNATINHYSFAVAAASVLTDWAFCILPMFMVWNMQMTPRTKVSVYMIFAL